MGNVWGRKASSSATEEAEEEHVSGSIEMKGSQPSEACTRRERSLSSWPLCLPDRSIRGVSKATADTRRSSRKDSQICEGTVVVGILHLETRSLSQAMLGRQIMHRASKLASYKSSDFDIK